VVEAGTRGEAVDVATLAKRAALEFEISKSHEGTILPLPINFSVRNLLSVRKVENQSFRGFSKRDVGSLHLVWI